MSIDPLLDRVYSRRNYNCFHFSAEAWLFLTGEDALGAVNADDFGRKDLNEIFRRFKRVAGPTIEPSVLVLETLTGEQHVGICLRRRLLHLTEDGVQFLPIDAVAPGYRNLRYYQ